MESLRTLLAVSADPEAIEEVLASANRLFKTDIAIVSEIEGDDYRVVHAAAPEGTVGAGDHFELAETYCAMTMCGDGVVAIDVMGESPQRGHPCYKKFGLESYIGIPLVVRGERYGTLNFSSPKPRDTKWDERDRLMMEIIAGWVTAHLERKAAQQDLQDTLQMLSLLGRSRRIGWWRVDVRARHVHWSDATYAIHEEPVGKTIDIEKGISYYVEEHRPIIEARVNAPRHELG